MTGQRSNQLNYVPTAKTQRLSAKTLQMKALQDLHTAHRVLTSAWDCSSSWQNRV